MLLLYSELLCRSAVVHIAVAVVHTKHEELTQAWHRAVTVCLVKRRVISSVINQTAK